MEVAEYAWSSSRSKSFSLKSANGRAQIIPSTAGRILTVTMRLGMYAGRLGVSRMQTSAVEHIPRGHPLSGNNARVRSRNGSTQRECRICRRLFRNMGEAAQRFSHKPLVLLNGVPPLVPWNSVPKTWPANEKTAAILAQKVLAKQARGRETPSDL